MLTLRLRFLPGIHLRRLALCTCVPCADSRQGLVFEKVRSCMPTWFARRWHIHRAVPAARDSTVSLPDALANRTGVSYTSGESPGTDAQGWEYNTCFVPFGWTAVYNPLSHFVRRRRHFRVFVKHADAPVVIADTSIPRKTASDLAPNRAPAETKEVGKCRCCGSHLVRCPSVMRKGTLCNDDHLRNVPFTKFHHLHVRL